ncbi:MAG: porin, partial [Alteromonadales bacterium]|nr:porin [Alteromonadales bacterium]
MKKTLLATAILSGLVSLTAGAATVYDQDGTTLKVGGRVEVRGLFADSVEGTMEDKSRARINFGGETQISENLTGFGFVEYEISPNAKGTVDEPIIDTNEVELGEDTDSGYYLKNRYLFAGIGTQIGDFSYGKQDTANVQISDFSDISSTHSGLQGAIDASSSKQSNVFLYSGTFADALTVQVDYQAAEEKDMDTFAISAAYAFDFGLGLGAA